MQIYRLFSDIINLSYCEIYSTFFIVFDPNRDWTQSILSYLCSEQFQGIKILRGSENHQQTLKVHHHERVNKPILKTLTTFTTLIINPAL